MADDPSGALLRERGADADAKVGSAELFFDLVFVFAVTQLSHTLLAHLTPIGVVQTALLFVALWSNWVYTAWGTNWLDPERTVVRLMLFALMTAGLFASMSIPDAFAGRGHVFALALVAMHLCRAAVMIWAARGEGELRRNFTRLFLWLSIAAAFWVWGGFAAPGERLALWGVALAIEIAGPMLRYPIPALGRAEDTHFAIEGSHLAERCGLFVIIALGESILITGATFAGQAWRGPASAAFASAFIGTVAMWWIYFNIGATRGQQRFEESEDEDDPAALARSAYTYQHIPIVAGVVVTAASDEIALARPQAVVSVLQAACLIGGPMLYLLGNGLFKRATASWFPLSHWIGLGLSVALAIVALATRPDALTLSIASTAILLVVAVWETCSYRNHGAGTDREASAH